MLSRRKFLQSNLAGMALPLAGTSTKAAGPAAAGAAPHDPAKRDYWEDWPHYLIAKVNEARARRKALLASIRTPDQVRERIEMVRRKVWELIGGPLEKSPLNARTAGTIERQGYRIEKIIFESQPQVYVTAHLYVPSTGQPPFPGILAPLGHTREGKAYRNYQYVYQTLARKGYIVLAFDPFGQGERLQYLDPHSGRSRFGPTGEHSQAGRPLLLLRATFAQYRVWDAVRALDYLTNRPEVDPQRIGCTGHSGGGTVTMYLCALEPRIQVAVEVEGNSENFAGPNYDPPGAIADAEQNLIASLEAGLDRGDLLWAFAPKPLLICYTPQDAGTTYSPHYVEGTQEIFEEAKWPYSLLGTEKNIQLFASPLPHEFDFFTRQATYAWFNSMLAKKALGTDEAEFDFSPQEVLNCTTTGQVLTSVGGRSLVQINTDRARVITSSRAFLQAWRHPQDLREHVRSALIDLLALTSEKTPLEPRVVFSRGAGSRIIEEFEFSSEPPIRVPGWLIKPTQTRPPFPTVLYIPEGGKNRVVGEPGEMDDLLRRGFAVCAIDLRGLGVTAPRYPVAGPLFYRGEHFEDGYAWASLTLGKPVLGQRVWDFLRCLDYLETHPEVDPGRLYILGVRGGGLVALAGAFLHDEPRSLLLERFPADLSSVVDSDEYSLGLSWFVFGFLRQFDLPDLIAALAPKPCWLLNAEGPRGERLPETEMHHRYEDAIRLYSERGGHEQLRILVRPDEERAPTIHSWLENS